jgi:putative tributyrin esterase
MMIRAFIFLYAVLFLFAGFSCSAPPSPKNNRGDLNVTKENPGLHLRDTVISLNGRLISLDYPEGTIHGAVLCLPGWNFSRTDVCEKSAFCGEAKREGYVLILPEMGKSIYASALFPETRTDWKGFPQLSFLIDTLIPGLQKEFNLLKYGQNNFLYGISTGGRGVAMIALHTDSLFKAGAALSGDFDPVRMPGDNLMKGFYGEFDKFKERWNADNPSIYIEKFVIPLYLAHGVQDKTVPADQSASFHQKLSGRKNYPEVKIHLDKEAGHDYAFWGNETAAVLAFFRKYAR